MNPDKERERNVIEGVLEHLAILWHRTPTKRTEIDASAQGVVYLICQDKKEREIYLRGYRTQRKQGSINPMSVNDYIWRRRG